MQIGLIRCRQTEDMCPATACLKVIEYHKEAFAAIDGHIGLTGINTCGGCPGKRAVTRAAEMVRRGADTIVLASCITKGTPIGFPCPYAQQLKAAIVAKIGSDIRLIDHTH